MFVGVNMCPWTAILFLGLCLNCGQSAADGLIDGSRAQCQNEGEKVEVDIENMSCFHCICKNGFVECEQEQCPIVKNCYMQMPREKCCVRCKGCWYAGVHRVSDTEWTEPGEPCRVLRCDAGVVTVSDVQCHTPCDDPRSPAPGQCCPTCQGCYINGQRVLEGRDVTIPEDPCLKCHCARGRLTCAKRACPVLPCPRALHVTQPGDCCAQCVEGKAAIMIPDTAQNKPCVLGQEYHPHGAGFAVDRCTRCECRNGTSVCARSACPVTECSAELLLRSPDDCCPRCPPVEEVKTACIVAGTTYEDGESWQLDACKSCMCHAGEAKCALERCPPINCPNDQRMVKAPGQCCSKCVEKDGVCTVFGDPHYKTFDGKFYSFQGPCKYQLTTDCFNHTFSIRITNDARGTKYSSWMKNVALRLSNTKINLGQKLRVKVDGQRVTLPFNVGNGIANITKANDSVTVLTSIGIKVVWELNGLLEVTASIAYKGKLCGLCGNYNSIVRDDLKGRTGRLFKEDNKADTWKFGSSWRVGGRKACTRQQEMYIKEKPCHKERRRIANKLCKVLNKSDAFSNCRHKLNPRNYYEACIKDICECPMGQCHCEALTAYAHECRRLGGNLADWKPATFCDAASAGFFKLSSSTAMQRHSGRRKSTPRNVSRKLFPFTVGMMPRLMQGKPRKPPPVLQ